MPVGNWNLEWLNHNSQRHYPLADDAGGTDQTGAFRLPTSFVVELDLPVHTGTNVGPAGFYVQSVSAYAGGYSITIGYQPVVGDPVAVAAALIPRQGFARNSVFAVGGIGDFADTVGKVVIGRLDDIDDQPPGFWQFDFAETRLDPDAVRPILRGVSSITCVNGDQRSVPLYGDVELVAGANIQIIPTVVSGQNPVIRISAISGEGTVTDCVCEGDSATADPILHINGVAPTPGGNFSILPGDCVQIEPTANGLRITDTCAKPCCGCAELLQITQDLERLAAQASVVEDFAGRLESSVQTMDLIVLGSKVRDRGCVQC